MSPSQITEFKALLICVLFLVPFTGFYVALGGLWGVLWTDVFQFVLKMGIVIAVAVYAVRAIGGMDVMMARLSGDAAGTGASDPLAIFPDFSRGITSETCGPCRLSRSSSSSACSGGRSGIREPNRVAAATSRSVSSAPGMRRTACSPCSGSTCALRIASLAVDHHRAGGHRAPSGVACAGTNPESGYMLVLNEHLPHAWRGVAMAGFLAAFMSTIATHLNWGASYLVSDFYRRFIKTEALPERTTSHVSRSQQSSWWLLPAYVAALLTSIKSGWNSSSNWAQAPASCTLLRWYWWRINAWSEIRHDDGDGCLALAACLAGSGAKGTVAPPFVRKRSCHLRQVGSYNNSMHYRSGDCGNAADQCRTRADTPGLLSQGPSWMSRLEADCGARNADHADRDLGRNLLSWVLGCAVIYLALFGAGKFIFRQHGLGLLMLLGSAVCAFLLYKEQTARGWGAGSPEAAPPISVRMLPPVSARENSPQRHRGTEGTDSKNKALFSGF